MGISESALPIYATHGFKYMRHLPRYVRVFDPERVAPISKLEPLGERLIRESPAPIEVRFAATVIGFAEAAELAEPLQRSFNCAIRDADYLGWRYANHPVYRYEAFRVRHDPGAGRGGDPGGRRGGAAGAPRRRLPGSRCRRSRRTRLSRGVQPRARRRPGRFLLQRGPDRASVLESRLVLERRRFPHPGAELVLSHRHADSPDDVADFLGPRRCRRLARPQSLVHHQG
jgi:hypothetical protein